MKQTRRIFIGKVAAAGAAVPFMTSMAVPAGESAPAAATLKTGPAAFPVRLFSKPIDSYDFGFMCECLAGAGIEGFDLTVRPGGKVEPDKVETDLPKLVAEAKKRNLIADMMVTGIQFATDPFTERILKVASASGITHYRMGWIDYDLKLGVMETIMKYKPAMKELEAMNRKYKIHGGYQNHAGTRIGGPVWDIHELLKDIPADYLGSQYDVRHAQVEGANSWILGMRLLAPHIRTLAIKDFTWQNVNGKIGAIVVPLGEGMVSWDQFFKAVIELKITGPLTLHVEYPLLDKSQESLSLSQKQDIIVGKLKKDMDYLKGYLKKYNLA